MPALQPRESVVSVDRPPPPTAGRGRKRAIVAAARAALGLALLAFVVQRLDPARVLGSLSDPVWGALALAFAAQLAAKVVWTLRWQAVLRANGLERGFLELLALVLIGLFFNSFLPTSVGGDLVRGFHASRGREGLLASYAVLLVERALGAIALAALAAAAATVAWALGSSPWPTELLAAVTVLGGSIVAAGAWAFAWSGWPRVLRRAERFHERLACQAAGLIRALELFRHPGTPRAWIVANSLALQVIAVLFHVACARAVGLETPTVLFFLIVPASVLASMIPVSLNGLGVREGVLVGLLLATGAPAERAGAFAVLALLVSTVFALIGGLVNPFYATPAGEAKRAQPDA